MLASHDINSTEECQKRYYTLELSTTANPILYPDAFVRSRRIKYVHVIAAHLFVPGEDANTFERPTCYELHASFVQDELDIMNQFVCMFNQPLYKRKKYEQFNSVRDFKVWVRDTMDGNTVTLGTGAKIMLELMLEY